MKAHGNKRVWQLVPPFACSGFVSLISLSAFVFIYIFIGIDWLVCLFYIHPKLMESFPFCVVKTKSRGKTFFFFFLQLMFFLSLIFFFIFYWEFLNIKGSFKTCKNSRKFYKVFPKSTSSWIYIHIWRSQWPKTWEKYVLNRAAWL